MKQWSILINPFLIAGQKSYRQGLKISTYYNAQLLANVADPFVADLYSVYNLLHRDVSRSYAQWQAQAGTLKGNTLSVDQLLKLLCPGKIDSWEYQIVGLYAKRTPGYVGLFPKGRKPFHRGSKESKIAAVKQLGIKLTGIPELAMLKIEVDNYYAQLSGIREIQLGSKGLKGNKSGKVEVAIEKAMTTMFAHFGLLINLHIDNLSMVESYFDVNTIRNHEQIVFSKTVPAGKVRTIVKHHFNSTNSILINNDGTARMEFFLAPSKMLPNIEFPTVIVEPGEELTVPIIYLGDISNHFLKVRNLDNHEGHCILEFI